MWPVFFVHKLILQSALTAYPYEYMTISPDGYARRYQKKVFLVRLVSTSLRRLTAVTQDTHAMLATHKSTKTHICLDGSDLQRLEAFDRFDTV